MRREIISCDTCFATHDAHYVLPRAWITIDQDDAVQHFCSFNCLIDWAQKGLAIQEKPIEYVDPHKEPLFSESELKSINDLNDYIGNKDWRF